MKKDISYYIKCIVTTLIIFFEIGSVYGSVELIVEPDQIYFNYEEGNTNDALTLRDNNGVVITESEWDSYDLGRHKFAYIKGQTNRKIKVQFYSNYQGIMHLQIKLSYVPEYSDGIGTVCNFFVSNFDNSPSSPGTLILPLTGTLPNSIGTHSFQWKWEIYAIPVNNSNYCAAWKTSFTAHQYFTLLALPQAPMTQPWESVLDYACVWASGQISASNSASVITNALFNSGFVYDIAGGGASHYGSFDKFFLRTFIVHLGSSHLVNCLDMGKAVTTFCNAIGCSLGLSTYGKTGISENLIDGPINCVNPIGTTVFTNNPFGIPLIHHDCRSMGTGFSYHAFAESDLNKVWDATLLYDIDQDPDNVINSNPSCGNIATLHSWQLPVNEVEADYITKLIDSWPKWYLQTPTLNRNRVFSVE